MNLPPRNPNAGALNNAPNSPSAQAETAIQQQAVKESSNASTRAPQASAEMINQMRVNDAAQSTAQAAAERYLHYHKAVMQDRAGLTSGASTMARLAHNYAPGAQNAHEIAAAISKGLRL